MVRLKKISSDINLSRIISALESNGQRFEDIKNIFGYDTRQGLYHLLSHGGTAPATKLKNAARYLDVSVALLLLICMDIPEELMPSDAKKLSEIQKEAIRIFTYELNVNIPIDIIEKDQERAYNEDYKTKLAMGIETA